MSFSIKLTTLLLIILSSISTASFLQDDLAVPWRGNLQRPTHEAMEEDLGAMTFAREDQARSLYSKSSSKCPAPVAGDAILLRAEDAPETSPDEGNDTAFRMNEAWTRRRQEEPSSPAETLRRRIEASPWDLRVGVGGPGCNCGSAGVELLPTTVSVVNSWAIQQEVSDPRLVSGVQGLPRLPGEGALRRRPQACGGWLRLAGLVPLLGMTSSTARKILESSPHPGLCRVAFPDCPLFAEFDRENKDKYYNKEREKQRN
ncbi:hypothetical protein C7M84_012014 [Penaeus vannamei]|uniref:Uncharacterized protein n=1 Tax=Penaeus vannamei TaxID=6689 RepID=A0A423SZU8_PENVA|nr:hypothetical protein C7M84_012014 [Penaeus vannamei]